MKKLFLSIIICFMVLVTALVVTACDTTHSVNLPIGEGFVVSPVQGYDFNQITDGGSLRFRVTVAPTHHQPVVSLGDITLLAINDIYTITNISQNITDLSVVVSLRPPVYFSVNLPQGDGFSITALENYSFAAVQNGNNLRFSITVAPTHENLVVMLGDTKLNPANNIFTIYNITQNITNLNISVTQRNVLSVNRPTGAGFSVVPLDGYYFEAVEEGANLRFRVNLSAMAYDPVVKLGDMILEPNADSVYIISYITQNITNLSVSVSIMPTEFDLTPLNGQWEYRFGEGWGHPQVIEIMIYDKSITMTYTIGGTILDLKPVVIDFIDDTYLTLSLFYECAASYDQGGYGPEWKLVFEFVNDTLVPIDGRIGFILTTGEAASFPPVFVREGQLPFDLGDILGVWIFSFSQNVYVDEVQTGVDNMTTIMTINESGITMVFVRNGTTIDTITVLSIQFNGEVLSFWIAVGYPMQMNFYNNTLTVFVGAVTGFLGSGNAFTRE